MKTQNRKKMKKFLFVLMVPLFFYSCNPNEIVPVETTDGVVGVWINRQYNDGLLTFDKANEFIDDYGISFLENGNLIERKNIGWCGTPPITYGDFEGTQRPELVEVECPGLWMAQPP